MTRFAQSVPGRILLGGALATIVFDMFGQGISPLAGFASLAPVPLARQSLQVLFGIDSAPAAHIVHYLTGLIAYPLGWFLIVDPLRRMAGLGWLISAILYGVALWVFALYIMAHLIAGSPPFLGFTGITWVALVGHILFTVVYAGVDRLLVPAGRPALVGAARAAAG